MLSYRHAFHAGNHADVLKHCILAQVLDYYGRKDKAFWYIDSHAGAGLYALDRGYASQNAEFRDGIGRLWQYHDLPPAVSQYVNLVRNLNPDGALRRYPGSPMLALLLLRANDCLRLCELHPSDHKLLQAMQGGERRVKIEAADGNTWLKAQLPPPPRRAVVLIDPPYEQKQDYTRVVQGLKDSLQRFATGTYLLWYPLLARPEPRLLQQRLARLAPTSWLHATLSIQAPPAEGYGMHGSGLYVVNPPWTLPTALETVLPFLASVLGKDAGAGYTLEHHIP